MKTQIIRSWNELLLLENDWNQLLCASDANTVFLMWEWISAWRDAVATDFSLMTIVIRDDSDQLIAIAPFYIASLRLLKVMRLRCLRILGDHLCGSEYPNIIIRRDYAGPALDHIATVLQEHQSEWDCIWAPKFAGWQKADQSLIDIAVKSGFNYRKRPSNFSAIEIPENYEIYEKRLSKNARHHLRRSTKKVLKKFSGEMVFCRNKEELGTMLPELIRLNRTRWLNAGIHAGTFRFPQRKVFYERHSELMLSNNALGFYGLRIDGQFRALWYGYIHEKTYYSMSLGYDVEFENRYHTGVANVLFGLIIKELINKGVREFDHLGGITDYKLRWGAEPRKGADILLCNSTWKGAILHRSQMWPTGRYIQEVWLYNKN